MRAHTKGNYKMGKRFAIVIGVAAAGVMALGAQAAAAPDVVKYDTKLGIPGVQSQTYFGQVKSKVQKCVQKRQVVLFEQRSGADRKVGHDRSNRKGGWFVNPRGSARGNFYAKVRRKSGNGYVCRADRAPNHGTI